jgi:hypothetical protein
MARTEHLPTLRHALSRYSGQVYKQAYDLCLCLYLEQVVQSFSRYHEYSIECATASCAGSPR